MRRFYFVPFILVIFSVHYFGYCCKNYDRNPFVSHLAVVILARGGSKGIELKNIAKVGGTPLLRIALKEIKKVVPVDSIWVSTDNEKILQEAKKENVNIHWRSAESATDVATSLEGIEDFLKYHKEIDVLGLIQCTSPFIKSKYIKEAINYMRLNWECSFAVTRSHKLIWREIDSKIIPFNFNPSQRPRRQDWTGDLVENGMFYFVKRNLLQNGLLQSEK